MRDRLDELRQIPGRVPDGELHHLMVWSWTEGDRGGGGDAALLRGASGRWSSASTDGQYRFACGRERSETRRLGEGKSAWPDLLGLEWRVTTRAGAWREGGRACLDEFGADGFVFSVPVNGLMNGRLRLADAPRGDVWLNYNDIEAEGSWEINRRPVANAGADQMHECEGHHGVHVTLNGTASSDPDGQSLTYEWRGPFGTATGASPTVAIPLGRHEVVLVVDDGLAGASADTVVITVVDTKPPVIHSASPSPSTLWAPNHKMEPVTVTVDVSDICDPAPACRIVSVASNESVNGAGDGNTAPDWRLVAPLVVELRAERSGKGSGRVYTIRIECTDSSGNAAPTQVAVTVSHDQGRP
jgi:hypothetical protein